MHINCRHIALISDNCPSHPPPERPPIDYTGPPPPTLTNITLIYLPPCKTAYLQPLDMGTIKSFKAAYRRLYAEYMVERFNEFGATLEKIDILKAIYLSSMAWDSVTPWTIQNCWTKTNITTISIPSDISSLVDIFIREQRLACLHAFQELRGLEETDYQNLDKYFENFFTEDSHALLQAEVPEPAQLPDSSILIA
ncbi:DDE-domain-containing protein [Tuber magnatum]|uniref:DDE-domain-containing protein n=1 Tax=Tuber magnatum TaxID=42249 RepID=A0A317SHG1_9PEZI|nr:DDE-domain-containing protein [Tuber magnatum]